MNAAGHSRGHRPRYRRVGSGSPGLAHGAPRERLRSCGSRTRTRRTRRVPARGYGRPGPARRRRCVVCMSGLPADIRTRLVPSCAGPSGGRPSALGSTMSARGGAWARGRIPPRERDALGPALSACSRAQIVRDRRLRAFTHELGRAPVRGAPAGQRPGPCRLGVGAARRPEHRDEALRLAKRPGVVVVSHRHRVPRVLLSPAQCSEHVTTI